MPVTVMAISQLSYFHKNYDPPTFTSMLYHTMYHTHQLTFILSLPSEIPTHVNYDMHGSHFLNNV